MFYAVVISVAACSVQFLLGENWFVKLHAALVRVDANGAPPAPACMAALSSAALLLMQSHQLALQGICGHHLTTCVVGTASQHCPVKCTALHWVSCRVT